MTALTDQYLAALVRHDPATFKIYAIDPASNQVGFYGVMKENNKPLIIALRLKVVDGEITESSTCWRAIFGPIECRT